MSDVIPHLDEIDTSTDCWADTVDRVVYDGIEYRVKTALTGDPRLIKNESEE
jgi:hypothetical protein